ncbi:MAG: hypothetical protein ACYDBJ_25865 [Aggregatilineales bacterium]
MNGYRHQRHGQARDARLQALWSGPVLFLDAEKVANSPETAQAELFALLTIAGVVRCLSVEAQEHNLY